MLWEDNYLAHFGIKGQKWGIRRFQNLDGTLTEAGKKHYGISANEFKEKATADAEKLKAQKQASTSGQMTGAKKPSIFQQIKANWQAMYLPPEMQGKSKEEIKAWEKKENEKFNAESKKEDTDLKFGKQLDKYDKLSPEEKKKVGNEVLKRLEEYRKNRQNATHDDRKAEDGLVNWLFEKIDKTSATNWNVGESNSKESKKILSRMGDVSEEYSKREQEIKQQIKYKEVPYTKAELNSVALQLINDAKREKEWKRLQEALKNDSVVKSLTEQHNKLEKDLCGQVLKDLGFEVTASNISMIYPYVINP